MKQISSIPSNAAACSARFSVQHGRAQPWVIDHETDRAIAMCVRTEEAEMIVLALNIHAELQAHLVDCDIELKDAYKKIPKGGTGSLTARHLVTGARNFGLELSNWISRREIELSRQNADVDARRAGARNQTGG